MTLQIGMERLCKLQGVYGELQTQNSMLTTEMENIQGINKGLETNI